MGCYINPPSEQTKEEWLAANAQATEGPTQPDATHVPVCLVRNPTFSDAAVGYSQSEVEAFSDKEDKRPKKWYRVPREKVRTVSPLAKFEKHGGIG